MGASDSLASGTSYYMAEVLALLEIVNQGRDAPHLFIFDELLRGTNSLERVAAVSAVLRYLAAKHLVAVATHDLELTSKLDDVYQNVHFSDRFIENSASICFDYKLRPGPSPTRNALKILRSMGFPEEILVEAERDLE